jgi:type I restriction enzyme M protein
MLDSDTKRRIDTARDILVGKVPDPKSQVEQITLALIYKFMDDIDAESEKIGGKRDFFANGKGGDFARYGWAKLMAPGVSGHELVGLYGEGIAKMPENPGIPPLFRDIFKNAYLPYRDPETLKSFLKVIDEFEYDHSERLGDAFEYLLSVLGSQGDAGQFRTPRHIIDFIVRIVDPKKNESILDPACGTAGFLISAYKHIVAASTIDGGKGLTPDERKKLADGITGYDISPDMVRLSRANMYLHGFADPHIYEYDTLTSQERWKETADVILANPPFMSPKGGIKPHNRFRVPSKRSEVLFVDYMAEHLTPNGRAGIIVPEGIIFQSQTAYVDLRKMLVNDYLVAVVSLPAGVFNPYSGVKTSILILDRSLAKLSDSVGFFKVDNDGFGLGAQRREVKGEQLTRVAAEIGEYSGRLRARHGVEDFTPTLGLIVPKAKIAADADYNLSAERYRENGVTSSAWPSVPVGEVFRKADESVLPDSLAGAVTYIGLENITQNTGELAGAVVTEDPSEIKSLKNVFNPGDILYGKLRPNLNKVWLADRKGICSTDIFVIHAVEGRVVPALYAYIFRSGMFNDAVMGQLKGAQLPRVGWASFAELEIPLPPLEVQREIVAEIEGYQKVIDGARAVLDQYRPHIPIRSEWPMVVLREVCELERGVVYAKEDEVTDGGHEVLRANNIDHLNSRLVLSDIKQIRKTVEFDDQKKLRRNDIFICLASGSKDHVGKAAYIDEDTHYYFGGFMGAVRSTDPRLHPKFLFFTLSTPRFNDFLRAQIVGANINNLSSGILFRFSVPLPPLEIQLAIVADIEAEQRLVAANHELVARFEKKIEAAIARVWGEEAPPAASTPAASEET